VRAVAVQGNGATNRAVRTIATLAVFDVEFIVKEAEPQNHTLASLEQFAAILKAAHEAD
jgi:hypothetical protein